MGLPVNYVDASVPALGGGTDQVGDQVSDQVTPQVGKHLAVLHGEISLGELKVELGLSGLFASLENGKTV